MSVLTNELKSEHQGLVSTLNEVKALGISSQEGITKLLAAKNGLLAHLSKEDQKLYPVLNKEAEGNSTLKTKLDMFAKDMDGISKAALDFFAKYQSGGEGLEFAKDFGGLVAVLGQRIQREESILYAEFDKINS